MTGTVMIAADGNDIGRVAADIFVAAADEAVRLRGVFRVALSGGATPQRLYERLATADTRRRVSWDRVRVFFGDERHVGPNHADSNFRMAHDALLGRVPLDPRHVWRIKGEYVNADDAAREYERDIRAAFALGPTQLPRFDLVLLGLGADGHTASLFPFTGAIYERTRLVVANRVETLRTDRITLTVPVLNHAAQVLFLVSGADKAPALEAVLAGTFDPDRIPAQLIHPVRGQLRWIVDSAAARSLPEGVELP